MPATTGDDGGRVPDAVTRTRVRLVWPERTQPITLEQYRGELGPHLPRITRTDVPRHDGDAVRRMVQSRAFGSRTAGDRRFDPQSPKLISGEEPEQHKSLRARWIADQGPQGWDERESVANAGGWLWPDPPREGRVRSAGHPQCVECYGRDQASGLLCGPCAALRNVASQYDREQERWIPHGSKAENHGIIDEAARVRSASF